MWAQKSLLLHKQANLILYAKSFYCHYSPCNRFFSISSCCPNAYVQHDSIRHSAIFLSDYIQYSSLTGNEKFAGQYLAAMAMIMGIHIEIFSNHTDTFNFAASLYPLSLNKPNIIFLNHIDVVPAENCALFTYPLFSGANADGQV